MACDNCNPGRLIPGKLIKVNKFGPDMACSVCGDKITMRDNYFQEKQRRWDTYFYLICKAVATKSPCLSRRIGAALVRDNSIISTGYNGPPRGVPHCGHNRYMEDDSLVIGKSINPEVSIETIKTTCPRRIMGIKSGEGMQWCPAQHAEENAVSNAARNGVSVINTVLYMNSVIPCQKCFGTLINAGVVEIVIESKTTYDIHTKFLIDNSKIKIREFTL